MLKQLKVRIAALPVVGPIIHKMYAKLAGRPVHGFVNSGQYWEDRYRTGGNSGSGSYGRLATFKAEFINSFVREKKIGRIVEFGCGDGAQLELADYPIYTGFDVSQSSVDMCRKRFAQNPNYDFHLVSSNHYRELTPVDLTMSIDVIYHLVEDDVYHAYMHKLFGSSQRFVVVYSYDVDIVYATGRHERGRNFTTWVRQNAPEWSLIEIKRNPYPFNPKEPDTTSQADFFVFERSA